MKIRQKQLLKSVFLFKGDFNGTIQARPKVFDGIEIAPFWNDCKASVSISADFELNWAFRSLGARERDQLGTTERRNVPYILRMLDELNIPITWATVGHLFLKSCIRENELAHRHMPRPQANPLWDGDWYKHDPCTNVEADPLWYAPDLIEQIMATKVRHEIGSHSFSHIDFSRHTSSRELVQREMEESRSVMAELGLQMKSLVFPFNHMGHGYHDVLRDFGIVAVRHRDNTVRVAYPQRTSAGVYKIYETMNLRSPSLYEYRDKADLFISHAVEHGAAYHLWFHPSDPLKLFQREFYEILQLVNQRREMGELWVATMGELASYCEARECMSIQSTHDGSRRRLNISSWLNTAAYGIPDVSLTVPVKTTPKRIEQRIGANYQDATSDKCTATYKSGNLVLNVPALTQSIDLIF